MNSPFDLAIRWQLGALASAQPAPLWNGRTAILEIDRGGTGIYRTGEGGGSGSREIVGSAGEEGATVTCAPLPPGLVHQRFEGRGENHVERANSLGEHPVRRVNAVLNALAD